MVVLLIMIIVFLWSCRVEVGYLVINGFFIMVWMVLVLFVLVVKSIIFLVFKIVLIFIVIDKCGWYLFFVKNCVLFLIVFFVSVLIWVCDVKFEEGLLKLIWLLWLILSSCILILLVVVIFCLYLV